MLTSIGSTILKKIVQPKGRWDAMCIEFMWNKSEVKIHEAFLIKTIHYLCCQEVNFDFIVPKLSATYL
jgi:hypothetical protein